MLPKAGWILEFMDLESHGSWTRPVVQTQPLHVIEVKAMLH